MATYTADQVVKLYREYAKVSVPIRAFLVAKGNSMLQLFIDSSQRDLERSEAVKSVRNYLLDYKSLKVISTSQPVDITSEMHNNLTHAGDSRAVIRKTFIKKTEEKCFLEVWKGSSKLVNLDLQAYEIHGKVYEDGHFGCLNWSSDGNYLLYVAEKKRPKTESYFKHKPSTTEPSSSGQVSAEIKPPRDETEQGAEGLFIEDWGEAQVGKHHPVLCTVKVDTQEANIIEGLPDDVSPGQAVWVPGNTGVVCAAWWHEPRRLGVTFCTNRRSAIFHVKLGTKECELIGSDNQSVHTPRFSLDGKKLIYFESDLGGPHHKSSRLLMCLWPGTKSTVVVNTVNGGKGFPGLYIKSLPKRIWAKDSKRVVLHTQWGSRQALICVNTETGSVQRLTKEDDQIGSWTLLDIWEDFVVAACSSPGTKPFVQIGRLPLDCQKEAIEWIRLESEETELPTLHWNVISLTPPREAVNPKYKDLEYEVILLKPAGFEGQLHEIPLIIWPHGGPHSAHVAGYSLFANVFAKLGFACSLINYRGSEGFGEDNLKSLLGNIGSQDVLDCQNSMESLIENEGFNPKKVVVFGGSHGGFLAAHLIGQYPKMYKACVMRNPVVDLTSMVHVTDIPDWSWVEAGLPYGVTGQTDPDSLKSMWEKSPIRYIDHVTTPTLLLMGKIDLRVPPNQSLMFYHALKSRNATVRLHSYEDNHSLSKVDVEADCFVNTALWFLKHLNAGGPQLSPHLGK